MPGALMLALSLVVGQLAAGMTLTDQDGAAHALPSGPLPMLLVYEDQDGQKQSHVAKAMIARYNDRPENRAKLKVWPVADLSKWNWWPAKSHALADVKKSAVKNNTQILIDWTGAAHTAWGLGKGKNSLVLFGADGRVRYAVEGECSAAQKDALEREFKALGLSL